MESHGPSGTPHHFVHETFGSIGRDNEDGYDRPLTGGYLDLARSRSFGNRDGTYPSGEPYSCESHLIDGIWQPKGHMVTDQRFGVGWSIRRRNTI